MRSLEATLWVVSHNGSVESARKKREPSRKSRLPPNVEDADDRFRGHMSWIKQAEPMAKAVEPKQ